MTPSSPSVAVVGAGLAGCSCAAELARRGCAVALFDLGRRNPGGRSSRRGTTGAGGAAFDHGVQVFQGASPRFREVLKRWEAAGWVAPWAARLGALDGAAGTFTPFPAETQTPAPAPAAERPQPTLLPGLPVFVGRGGADAVCRGLAATAGVALHFGSRVETVARDAADGRWRLGVKKRQALDEGEAGAQEELGDKFDALVLADVMTAKTGTPGSVEGLAAAGLGPIAERMAGVKAGPQFALMVALAAPLAAVPFDGAVVDGPASSQVFQWVARDSSKPGAGSEGGAAGGPECWVAVTTPAHAARLIGGEVGGVGARPLQREGRYNPQTREYLDPVADHLLEEFRGLLAPFTAGGAAFPDATFVQAQRWGGAFQQNPLELPEGALADPERRFAACGDWATRSSVEGAALSGLAAADRVAAMLGLGGAEPPASPL